MLHWEPVDYAAFYKVEIADDPQFQHRLPWLPAKDHGADMLPFPVHFAEGALPAPGKAPTVGEHSDAVLRDLGYDEAKVEALRAAGAFGD